MSTLRFRWLAVVGVVLLQTLLTFGARWISSLFGQDLLAEAREYIVRVVLRLPLGKVESASTGDLVTRVTRDVSTMSAAVRWSPVATCGAPRWATSPRAAPTRGSTPR